MIPYTYVVAVLHCALVQSKKSSFFGSVNEREEVSMDSSSAAFSGGRENRKLNVRARARFVQLCGSGRARFSPRGETINGHPAISVYLSTRTHRDPSKRRMGGVNENQL